MVLGGYKSFVPIPGEPYPDRKVAIGLMLAGHSDLLICVSYHDEDGVQQERWLSPGWWPIASTRVNGYATLWDRRLEGDVEMSVQDAVNREFLRKEVRGGDFEISVLL